MIKTGILSDTTEESDVVSFGELSMAPEEVVSNVFEDLGLPDAKERLIKSTIATAIHAEIAARGLRQSDAARIMGIKQPDVSNILRGRFDHFSIDRMIRLLETLDLSVELSIVHKTA